MVMKAVVQIALNMAENIHSGWKLIIGCMITIESYQSSFDTYELVEEPQENVSVLERNSILVNQTIDRDELRRFLTETKLLSTESFCQLFIGMKDCIIEELSGTDSRFQISL